MDIVLVIKDWKIKKIPRFARNDNAIVILMT